MRWFLFFGFFISSFLRIIFLSRGYRQQTISDFFIFRCHVSWGLSNEVLQVTDMTTTLIYGRCKLNSSLPGSALFSAPHKLISSLSPSFNTASHMHHHPSSM
ncbi:hypothetical protein V8C44DRAFT_328092, partial [Trichoderma aethiopicum]